MTVHNRLPFLSLAATALAVTGLAVGSTWGGVTIDKIYTKAFDRIEWSRSTQSRQPSALDDRLADRGAGLDPANIHLSRLAVAETKRPAFAVGDRMTLAAREGVNRTFDVVEVRPLTGGEAGVAGSGANALSGTSAARLFLVTAVSTGDLRSRTVRFIIDADGPADLFPVQDAPARPHAL